MSQVLVAGIGNVFLGDDAFGSDLVRRIASRGAIQGVELCDFGIRTMDLFFALERAEKAVIVDLVKRGQPPGTLYVIDPTSSDCTSEGIRGLGGHGPMTTDLVAWSVGRSKRGERPRKMLIVGCEPFDCAEDEGGRVGLSEPVEASMAEAMDLVMRVATELSSRSEAECTSSA